jgi:hypothetical protein
MGLVNRTADGIGDQGDATAAVNRKLASGWSKAESATKL